MATNHIFAETPDAEVIADATGNKMLSWTSGPIPFLRRAPVGTKLYALAAPPPAAARGDVRGLVRIGDALQKMRNLAQVIRKWGTCAPLALDHIADELESALAAEGVQAGDVVYAVQTGDADEKGNLLYAIADEPFPMADNWRLYTSALPLPPEARGVVDVEAIRRACQSGKRFWQAGPGYYEEIESLLPALTGERNG